MPLELFVLNPVFSIFHAAHLCIGYAGENWSTKLDDELKSEILSGNYKNFYQFAFEKPLLAGHAFWYYIEEKYKRENTTYLLYLARVLAGLCTVFLKIYHTKTTYYLLRLNAWVAILLLVFASAIHWDETIAQYNLARKSTIPLDVPFLLSLSDKTLPLLRKNEDVLENASDNNFCYGSRFYYTSPVKFLAYREKEFLKEQQNYTWLSWNLADAQVKKELTQNTHLSQIKW